MSPSRIWGFGAPLEIQRNMNSLEFISLSFIVVMIADNISPSFLGHSHLRNELHEVTRLGFTHFLGVGTNSETTAPIFWQWTASGFAMSKMRPPSWGKAPQNQQ